ncbi:hypothetical protein NBRC10513_006572 [Rhodotorula toruloides]|uniref:Mannosyltransferase putative-domain containing protein n=1 Tax=Rhodotorula toruloides TaxID=5286 RepID=A0A2S9ZYN0_RHOTO|nr:Mannosyltransferase putative-domain containing protein [Rhodotorula toruloides]
MPTSPSTSTNGGAPRIDPFRVPLLPVSSSHSPSSSLDTDKSYYPASSTQGRHPRRTTSVGRWWTALVGLVAGGRKAPFVLAFAALVFLLALVRYPPSPSLSLPSTLRSFSSPSSPSSSSPKPPADLSALFGRASQPLPLSATTLERLDEWETKAPGWEAEPADWVSRNLLSCPPHRIRPNQNGQLLDKALFLYASMNTSRVMGLRGEMVRYLREREGEGGMSEGRWGEGKGLVFTAGNADTFSRVLTTLRLLNSSHLSSPLPAEIFSFPGEEPDAETRKELEALGARLRVVSEARRGEGRRKNYHIKATAIIRSSFREVLYLDSDNIPAASLLPLELWSNSTQGEASRPAGLWEAKAYKRLGAMFWPDYWRTHPINPIWAVIGVPCRDEWEMEAGTILIDKSRHLDALLLAEWMMSSERFEYWFNFSDGDKDIFRFAFLALRKRWGVPGRYVSVGALPRDTISGFCGHSMLQNDHLGKPLFVHANLLKQISSGVGKGFAWGRHRQLRTPPSSLSLQGLPLTPSHKLELDEPLTDDDIDCDMVADVGYDGFPQRGRERVEGHPQEVRIRRRAVWEKGIRAGFKGGGMFALCIDIRFDDPRSEDETWSAKLSVASSSPNPSRLPLEALAANVDVSYTAAPDGFELKFWQDEVLEVVHWADVPRLKGFEEAFFEVGGKVNGEGF